MSTNNKTSLTVRVLTSKKKALEKIAKNIDRDKSYIVNEALDNYLVHQDWIHKHIQKGVAEADRREFASDAEVRDAFKL